MHKTCVKPAIQSAQQHRRAPIHDKLEHAAAYIAAAKHNAQPVNVTLCQTCGQTCYQTIRNSCRQHVGYIACIKQQHVQSTHVVAYMGLKTLYALDMQSV